MPMLYAFIVVQLNLFPVCFHRFFSTTIFVTVKCFHVFSSLHFFGHSPARYTESVFQNRSVFFIRYFFSFFFAAFGKRLCLMTHIIIIEYEEWEDEDERREKSVWWISKQSNDGFEMNIYKWISLLDFGLILYSNCNRCCYFYWTTNNRTMEDMRTGRRWQEKKTFKPFSLSYKCDCDAVCFSVLIFRMQSRYINWGFASLLWKLHIKLLFNSKFQSFLVLNL